MSEQILVAPREDRTMPAIAYGLFLLGPLNGLTVLIGLIVAYSGRGTAAPATRSHLDFLIRTFWMSIGWFLIGWTMVFWGAVFSLILVGLPVFGLGWLILGVIHIWFFLRLILGVIHLARGEAYPRPRTWLI